MLLTILDHALTNHAVHAGRMMLLNTTASAAETSKGEQLHESV